MPFSGRRFRYSASTVRLSANDFADASAKASAMAFCWLAFRLSHFFWPM